MRLMKYIILILCMMVAMMSTCFAKITEINDTKQTIFNSTNVLANENVSINMVIVKLFYPAGTGYSVGFNHGKTLEENESFNYMTNAIMRFDGDKTYSFPPAKISKLKMYGAYAGKYSFESYIDLCKFEDDVQVRRLVNLIKASHSAEVIFTFNNKEEIAFAIPEEVFKEWKQVVAYPEVI